MRLPRVCVLVLCSILTPAARCAGPASEPADAGGKYFAIEVVDDQTGRGVPLVELSTVSHVSYWTDSAGRVAVDDPALLGRKVFFYVRSHGYDFPADGFGYHGKTLDLKPGGSARIKIRRVNLAERLYRVTGEGIYRDSVLLGRAAPIRQPLLDAQVVGQDSIQAAVYRGKVYCFWGDTMRPAYPLGHFGTAGATAELPGEGGLDPAVGVDLKYFTDAAGFSRPVLEPTAPDPSWLDALLVVKDEKGADRLVARSSRMKSLGECVGRKWVVFNDQKAGFETLAPLPVAPALGPSGQPFHSEAGGADYVYFADPFPAVRVKATWGAVQNLAEYEGFTCLAAGARYDEKQKEPARLDRAADGRLAWAWKKDTPPLSSRQQQALIRAGQMRADEAWFRPVDAGTNKPVTLAAGSVEYNAFRKRWVMIAAERGGANSFLGEIWYAEADRPEGPWPVARKILTHDRYSFYNPRHHAFFDQRGGRIIYFEGTYAAAFSREGGETPRYDYNQIMYRLDLGDPRLEMKRKE